MNIPALRGAIASRYKTQKIFSEAMNWHKNKTSKMLTGKYLPNTDEVASISRVLNLSEEEFCLIFLPNSSPNGDKSMH